MKVLQSAWFVVLIFGLLSCNNDNYSIYAIKTVASDFESSTENWTGALAEYTSKISPSDTNYIKLKQRRLPTGLDTTRYALSVTSINPDASIFAYIKKQVTGLNPGHTYNVSFEIEMSTNVAQNNAAATVMFLKAGAAPIEPKTDATTYAFNLDKGKGSADGKRMVTLGNVSNDQNKSGYVLVPRGNNDKPVQVEADSNGKIWLCIGIDSGYKGTTLVFFDSIKASIIEN